MWGCASNYPIIRSYADAERIYKETKPLRGTAAYRPLDVRSKRAKSQIIKRGDAYVIRLYSTDIVTYNSDGSVFVSCGDWSTHTTRTAIGYMSPFACWSSKGSTAIRCKGGDFIVPRTGLLVRADGTPVDLPVAVHHKVRVKKEEARAARKYFAQVPKLIEAYAAAFKGGVVGEQPREPDLRAVRHETPLAEEEASALAMCYLGTQYDFRVRQRMYSGEAEVSYFWHDVYTQFQLREQYEVPCPYGEVP